MSSRSPVLVSACLLGLCCRYDGKAQANERVLALAASRPAIPVCPEQLGGLATPRSPAERSEARVVTRGGEDVTEAFARGARESLRLARLFGCRAAVLKANSPSCGSGQIYDGSFSGRLVPGDGLTAALLKENGIAVFTEADDFDALL
ncbi:MAG: DUF523 domain-containing protein [Clostridiales bacterium]|nr:DUF523 domain-containing protein [Clostridiales bacterium]